MPDMQSQKEFNERRMQEWAQWRAETTFMSVAQFAQKINEPQNTILIDPEQTFICVLQKPEDLLEVANRMENCKALVEADLLKDVAVEENIGEEELQYLRNEELVDTDSELVVSAKAFDYKTRQVKVVADVNQFYEINEQVHISDIEQERGDYTLIPAALTERALTAKYPCMLLVSDHSSFDRAGDMEIRHTMLFDMPKGLTYASPGYVHIELS